MHLMLVNANVLFSSFLYWDQQIPAISKQWLGKTRKIFSSACKCFIIESSRENQYSSSTLNKCMNKTYVLYKFSELLSHQRRDARFTYFLLLRLLSIIKANISTSIPMCTLELINTRST